MKKYIRAMCCTAEERVREEVRTMRYHTHTKLFVICKFGRLTEKNCLSFPHNRQLSPLLYDLPNLSDTAQRCSSVIPSAAAGEGRLLN